MSTVGKNKYYCLYFPIPIIRTVESIKLAWICAFITSRNHPYCMTPDNGMFAQSCLLGCTVILVQQHEGIKQQSVLLVFLCDIIQNVISIILPPDHQHHLEIIVLCLHNLCVLHILSVLALYGKCQ